MFRFKQFTVHQDKTAMKVCTDACLFGACVAEKSETKEISPEHILDIGTGTGLLSLMLAQKTNAKIDAVEINAGAFEQASENIAASPWQEKIQAHHISVLDLFPGEKYDLIICNPPFYESHLSSPDNDRNMAMHASVLPFAELMGFIKNNLSLFGTATLLLPYIQLKYFENIIAKTGLFITEKINIAHSPAHPFFRSILFISETEQQLKHTEISIKDSAGAYSDTFYSLLKDYYLLF